MTGLEDLKNVWINREGFARSYLKLCDLNERLDSLPSSEPFAKWYFKHVTSDQVPQRADS